MSLAEDEAERMYPTRYWDGTHVKEKFYCDTDDLQEAYLRGREANRNGRPDMMTLDPPPDLVEITEDLDAKQTTEAVNLLFTLFCRDPQFRRSLYKLDPVLFRRFTNGEIRL